MLIGKRGIPACVIVVGLTLSMFGQSGSGSSDATSFDFSTLRKSAEAGDPQAQFALAVAYDNGKGIAQNDDAAFMWYRKSAEQGYAPAQNGLGLMYREGRGVEKSKELAVEWYRKASRQKYGKAMFNLGTAYYNGDGVAINDALACAWFLLAQQYGSEPAREAVTRTTAGLQPWQTSAVFESVGDMYASGQDLPLEPLTAIEWYRKATQFGEPSLRVKLAQALVKQGGEQNFREALQSCIEATKKMYSPAALCAGIHYQKGIGTPQDLPEAARWFTKSAHWMNPQAMILLGEMYWDGVGVKKDRVEAYALVSLAASANLPRAKKDQTLYEQALSKKELEKAQKRSEEWAKSKQNLGLRIRPDSH